MTRLPWAVLIAGLVGLLIACGATDHDGSGPSGALFVEAFDVSGQPLAKVEISTDPQTKTVHTDAFGTALINPVPVGPHRVLGVLGARRASDSVRVVAEETARVQLVLRPTTSAGGSDSGDGTGGEAPLPDTGDGGTPSTPGQGGAGGVAGGASSPFINVATQVEALVVDPSRPYLYALDSVNNKMLFINLDTRKVEKAIFVGSKPVDLDFDLANNNAFVANWGSSEIAVVDLEAQEVARSIFVDTTVGTWEGNPYRLVVAAEGSLVFTEEDQWCDLKQVDTTTGVSIGVAGSLYQPDLAITQDRSTIYVGESGLSSTTLTRFSVSATGMKQVDVSGDSGGSSLRRVVLSGDDEYVFFAGQKYLAANLKSVLGKFSETIYASNADGSVVVGNKSVFNGANFAITGLLPISTTVLAMSPDGQTVYLYDTATSHILIHAL